MLYFAINGERRFFNENPEVIGNMKFGIDLSGGDQLLSSKVLLEGKIKMA